MAKKKNASQAEKIVTDTKRKAPAGKSSKKKPPKKAANRKTPPKVQTEYENPVSTGIVAGLACMGLCVLLALVCFKPEGALLLAVKAGILGLVGRAGLYFLIPALLYTGTINLFGKRVSVPMRSVCSIAFALLCGVVYHLALAGSMDFDVKAMFDGGVAGTSGGVICGVMAKELAKQGVKIKVISGDDPQAVSHVAANAGIAGAEHWVDAATLQSEAALAEAAEKCTVFGRVTPEQKRQLVHALQAKGHTVAMTGDGVNDVLALKDADCGIAMASGAQAASQVAQLVLLDSDFAALPGVVAEGRRVINNIQRSASLFLVKNIFSFLLSIVALALPLAYPFQPLQLSLVTFATIGAPAFFLALEPNHELVHGRFMRNVLRKALPGGLTDFLLVFCAQGFGYAFDIPSDMVGTICTLVILCVGLQILWGVCIPFTPLHWAIWGSMTVAGVGGVFLLARWLPLVRLDLGSMLVLVVLLALSAPTLAGLTFMGARLNGMVNDARNKIGRRKV